MTIHLSRNGQKFGPYTLVQVNHYLEDGTVLPTDDAWAEGREGWVPVSQFPEVIAPGALPPVMPQPPVSVDPSGPPPPAPQPYLAAPMPMIPQMPAAYPGMAPLPPSRSSRRTGIIVGIVAGVVVLGILIMVGLAALGRASQGSEAEEFAKLHQAYKSKILPMEVAVLRLLGRLDDAATLNAELSIARDIEDNLSLRILAAKTIDLNHFEIEELNEDYIKYCEHGRQGFGDMIQAYQAGNDRKGDAIIENLLKRQTDDLADWIKRFNRLSAKHGLPNLEAIMKELIADM